ncbi:DMT family transporter [Gluconacetobacter sacchari]|uniref:DMT family transporter n=1 Tax=Gluconacetobacter sacchari TaxID=92759 RepID=UPI0039B5B254
MSFVPRLFVPRPSPLLAGLGYGLAAGACWGIIFLAPLLVPDFSALQLAVARYVAYGGFSAALLLPRWRGVVRRLPGRAWGVLLGLGLAGNLGYYVLIATAVRLAGLNATSIVTGFLPVLVSCLGSREKGALHPGRLWPSLLLMIAGLVLVGMDGSGRPGTAAVIDPLARGEGLACAAAAMLAWSLFAIVNARWMARLPSVGAGEWGLASGVATGLLGMLALPFAGFVPAAHPAARWLVFGGVASGVALVASVLGGIFWNQCSRRLPMTLSGQMAIGETLFALLYGCLWSGHGLSVPESGAVVLLIGSVALGAMAHASPARD